MKRIGALPLILALIAAPACAAQLNTTSTLTDTEAPPAVMAPEPPAPQFVPAIEDLPLMPGLEPVPNEEMVFVTPRAGRIAESTAEGPVDIDRVYWFYRRTLPQLGWQMADMRNYLRDNEHLRIDAHADGKTTTVRFTVKPQ